MNTQNSVNCWYISVGQPSFTYQCARNIWIISPSPPFVFLIEEHMYNIKKFVWVWAHNYSTCNALGMIVGIHGASLSSLALALALALLLSCSWPSLGIWDLLKIIHDPCSPSFDEQLSVTKYVLQYQIYDEAPMKRGFRLGISPEKQICAHLSVTMFTH